MKRRGNCYVTCEALYHLLGGKESGWIPMCMRWEGDTHWFLMKVVVNSYAYPERHQRHAVIMDPTVSQFKTRPNYTLARAKGFLTKEPSRRARVLMETMVWQAQ